MSAEEVSAGRRAQVLLMNGRTELRKICFVAKEKKLKVNAEKRAVQKIGKAAE